MRLKGGLLLCFITVIKVSSYAQEFVTYPFDIDQYSFVMPFFNPSIKDPNKKSEITGLNKFYTGPLKEINTSYVGLNTRLNATSSHNGGIYFYNNKEGDFIQKNRFYINYNYTLPLSLKLKIGLGTNIGFIHYNFSSSAASAGGSSTTPDLSLGLSLSSEKINIGISSNQIIEGKLKPIDFTYKLKRQYNLSLNYLYEASEYVTFSPDIMFSTSEYKNDFLIGLKTILYDIGIVGINYFAQRRTSLYLGGQKIQLIQTFFDFSVSYSLPSKDFNGIKSNTLELAIMLYFPNTEIR